MQMHKSIAGKRVDDWAYLPADGSSGGILISWDSSIVSKTYVIARSFLMQHAYGLVVCVLREIGIKIIKVMKRQKQNSYLHIHTLN